MIKHAIILLTRKIGMDKSIAYSSSSRIVGGIAGVLSIFFIAAFLTDIEQGFYFTFGSILALQVFFELGLTGIITQFVAHEFSHLLLDNNFIFIGEERYISRLASLVHFCIKWYSILAILVLFFLMAIGFFYFNRYSDENLKVDWFIPWILICLGTALKFYQAPFSSILMGLGKVKEMSKIGFYQQLIIPLTTWVGLVSGAKLYVIGCSYLLSVVAWQVYIHYTNFDKILLNLWNVNLLERVQYLKEIFPYQWRIALSWVSGYFIFQLFNPVLFATEGPVVAGQMGLTLTALNAIQSLSLSWLNTKVPLYSQLIAQKNYFILDSLFSKTLKQMTGVCTGLLLSFVIFVYVLNVVNIRIGDIIVGDRFLTVFPILLLSIPFFLQQYVASWATYLRCHKKEPLLSYSVFTALLTGASTIFAGKYYGLYGIIVGYCIISIVTFPWVHYIFIRKKKEWH